MMGMASLSLTGCGSDDDDTPVVNINVRDFIGNWVCTASTDTWQGQSHEGLMVGKQLQIMEGGKYYSTSSDMGREGTWSISGNKISVTPIDGRTITATVTINGNTLILSGTTSENVTFTYTFIRSAEN